MARVLQCVASRGVVSKVSVTTRSTAASVTVRGAPGRGSSSNPSRRFATKRLRHLPTVCLVTRSSRATAVFVFPAAHSRITRARRAVACAVFGRRAQFSSASRSSPLTINSRSGRPSRRIRVLLSTRRTHWVANLFHELRTQDTSHSHRAAPVAPAQGMRVSRPCSQRRRAPDRSTSTGPHAFYVEVAKSERGASDLDPKRETPACRPSKAPPRNQR